MGTGTCALDDDICTSSGLCASDFICVDGECVNACTTIAQCPPDSTCVAATGGMARCVPVPIGDAGSLDAGPSGPVSIVSSTSFVVGNTTGTVRITPPTTTQPGDMVLLLLDRYVDSSAVAPDIGAGWVDVATSLIDGDSQELAWRIAASDEATDTSRYTFPATSDADVTILVLRGASSLSLIHSAAVSSPYAFDAYTGRDGELLLDVMVTDQERTCTVMPTEPTFMDAGHWHFAPFPLASPAPAIGGTCMAAFAEVYQVLATP